MLRPLHGMFQPEQFPDLLVGLAVSDDAAVYRISDDLAVIQTLDFFPPVVDDPYDYGAIAAANALSDVYAMGGRVVLALNISAFPADWPPEIGAEILRGGADKVAEAGGVLAGGHTVTDKEPKYGLSVMGLIHPDQVRAKADAVPGDILVLTKPLGVGIITTALKSQVANPAYVGPAVESMKKLNRQAAELIQEIGVHAVTDITGFALLGHSYEMATKSGVRLVFDLAALPFLDGAMAYAEQTLFPGGTCRNEDAYRHGVTFGPSVSEDVQQLLFTPETSGGLLISVSPDKIDALCALFAQHDHPCWVVGKVVEGEGIEVS